MTFSQLIGSALKVLAEKACWDVAEIKTKGDRQLLKYLVYLAVEAGYLEKVDELCDRYSLQGLPKARGIYCCTEPCLVFQNYTTLTVVFFILFRG
jgi:hypothetical protein